MKKQKTINFNPKVHYSVHNRKIFKGKMWLIMLALVIILLGCGVMFTFGAVVWDPDAGFEPKAEIKYWWQGLLVALGAVIAIAAIVSYVLINYKIFQGFYATQEAYWKSPEFKKNKAKALKVDLYKLKKKDLKWYKKIGYINAEQKRLAIEEQKKWIKSCKDKKEKVNYAKSKA